MRSKLIRPHHASRRRALWACAVALGVLLSLLAGVVLAAPPADPGYKLIAHPHGTAVVLERDLVADIFLKKKRDWPNGDAAFPVDLELGAHARISFSEHVLRRPVVAVRRYWQQIIFAGRGLPPPELSGDAAVVRYVLAHPGAIGYVSPGADVGAARVLKVK